MKSWPYWGGTLETNLVTGAQTVHYDVSSAYPELNRVHSKIIGRVVASRKTRAAKDAGHVGTKLWRRRQRVWIKRCLGAHDIYSRIVKSTLPHERPANGTRPRRPRTRVERSMSSSKPYERIEELANRLYDAKGNLLGRVRAMPSYTVFHSDGWRTKWALIGGRWLRYRIIAPHDGPIPDWPWIRFERSTS